MTAHASPLKGGDCRNRSALTLPNDRHIIRYVEAGTLSLVNRESLCQGGPIVVRFLNLRSFIRLSTPVLVLGIMHSPAQADPLTTFTLTDLGPGTPTFATGANGGIVIAGNGQTAYPFQKTQDTSFASPQSFPANFPLLNLPPSPYTSPNAYGNPLNVYSTVLGPIVTNGNGLYVALDASGVAGHQGSSEVYGVTQNPGGTWGAPTGMWTGGTQFDGEASAGLASITGVNKLNEVLGVGADPTATNGAGLPQTYLYNASTNSLLNLATLGVLQAGGWNNIMPVAIDDQGRILLEAGPPLTSSGSTAEHFLLLTPQGVSSDPLEVPAPEPGGLAIAVVAAAALALSRAIRSRLQP